MGKTKWQVVYASHLFPVPYVFDTFETEIEARRRLKEMMKDCDDLEYATDHYVVKVEDTI